MLSYMGHVTYAVQSFHHVLSVHKYIRWLKAFRIQCRLQQLLCMVGIDDFPNAQ